jgi:hypothetical protein
VPATTPVYALPYQVLTDPPNGADLGRLLALAVETELARIDAAAAAAAAGTAFPTYTPVWTASVSNPTLGNGSISGEYHIDGKAVEITIILAIGSTTNLGSGTYAFSVPGALTLSQAAPYYGSALIRDQSAAAHTVAGVTPVSPSSPTTVELRYHGGNLVSGSSPIALATGDFIRIKVIGQIA